MSVLESCPFTADVVTAADSDNELWAFVPKDTPEESEPTDRLMTCPFEEDTPVDMSNGDCVLKGLYIGVAAVVPKEPSCWVFWDNEGLVPSGTDKSVVVMEVSTGDTLLPSVYGSLEVDMVDRYESVVEVEISFWLPITVNDAGLVLCERLRLPDESDGIVEDQTSVELVNAGGGQLINWPGAMASLICDRFDIIWSGEIPVVELKEGAIVTFPLPVSKGNAKMRENWRTVGTSSFDMTLNLKVNMTRVTG
jgi:hypothetical protein